MGPLQYHIRQESAGFAWDVLAEDLTVVAMGHAVDIVGARVAAMLAILRETQTQRIEPSRRQAQG